MWSIITTNNCFSKWPQLSLIMFIQSSQLVTLLESAYTELGNFFQIYNLVPIEYNLFWYKNKFMPFSKLIWCRLAAASFHHLYLLSEHLNVQRLFCWHSFAQRWWILGSSAKMSPLQCNVKYNIVSNSYSAEPQADEKLI